MLCFVWTCDSRGKCNTSWGSPLNVPIWPPQHMDLAEGNAVFWFYFHSVCKAQHAAKAWTWLQKKKLSRKLMQELQLHHSLHFQEAHLSQGFSPLYWVCSEGMSSLRTRVARVGTGQHTAGGVDVFFELVRSNFVTCWLILPAFDQGMSHSSGSPPWRSLWF